MSPILGIFASQGRVTANSYESIATVTLGSNSSSISFSSIPSTFTHLQVRYNVTSTSATGDIGIYFNDDTTNIYSSHFLYGDGASTVAGGSANRSLALAGIQGSSTSPAGGVLDVLDYKNTNKNKTLKVLVGADYNGSGFIFLESTAWYSTAAINKITLYSGNNFTTNSKFALYGIK